MFILRVFEDEDCLLEECIIEKKEFTVLNILLGNIQYIKTFIIIKRKH